MRVNIMTETIITPLGKTTPIRASIREKTKARMVIYMKHAGFDDEGDFIDQCINYVCDKDKSFQVKEKLIADRSNVKDKD